MCRRSAAVAAALGGQARRSSDAGDTRRKVDTCSVTVKGCRAFGLGLCLDDLPPTPRRNGGEFQPAPFPGNLRGLYGIDQPNVPAPPDLRASDAERAHII